MTQALWNSDEITAVTGGELQGKPFTASGVSIDTRRLKSGDVFVALAGENIDGHACLAQAQQAGAAAAIVNRVPQDAPEGLPLVVVHHSQMALEELGRAARRRSSAAIIGVTGSLGKTSAKEMLKLALEPYGKVYATVGNYNNHLGLPLSLANMPRDTEFGVFEMGMNHAGEIDFLSRLAEPHIGLITTVEAAHLEFFDSVEQIARAKSELFVGMAAASPVILNADNPYFALMSELAAEHDLEVIGFGEAAGASFRVQAVQSSAQGTEVTYAAKGKTRHFRLGSLGMHWPNLAVAVLAIVDALELPLEKAEAALARFTEAPGRGQVTVLPWKTGGITVIDDAYNASPVSMRGALEKLGMIVPEPGGRRLAVLGEMLELGAESAKFHAELAPLIAAGKVDKLYAVGQGMEALIAALPETQPREYAPEAQALRDTLFDEIQPGDVVLFKGSHGSKVYRLVEALQENNSKVKHAL